MHLEVILSEPLADEDSVAAQDFGELPSCGEPVGQGVAQAVLHHPDHITLSVVEYGNRHIRAFGLFGPSALDVAVLLLKSLHQPVAGPLLVVVAYLPAFGVDPGGHDVVVDAPRVLVAEDYPRLLPVAQPFHQVLDELRYPLLTYAVFGSGIDRHLERQVLRLTQ